MTTVQVLVHDQYLKRFSEVVKRLQDAGLKIDEELKEVGVILGRVDRDQVAQLGNVEGVSAVEVSRQVQIAPPDSPVQ